MNPSNVLLDTGPLIALVDKRDQYHERTKVLFSRLLPPFLTCESVISEACFILSKASSNALQILMALGREGLYKIPFVLQDHFLAVESIFKQYKNRSISLADACLIRCAEIFQEGRILTFDSDFKIYRWGRRKKFEILG